MIESQWFRKVLGQYPTGVTAITATEDDGRCVGMIVGSFTSVSLSPPLVAFFPSKSSTTWPRIEATGSFCVNVLSAGQEHVCRAFISKAPGTFEEIGWEAAGSGSPILSDVLAWVDCDIESIVDAGDHHFVLGRVRELDIATPSLPLLFFQGGYGQFTPSSLAAAEDDLLEDLFLVDIARPAMERLATHLGCEVLAAAPVKDELVLLASAGSSTQSALPARIGQRLPLAAPVGRTHMAWLQPDTIAAWAAKGGADLDETTRILHGIRQRGYSISLTAPLTSGHHRVSTGSELLDALDPGAEIDDPAVIDVTQRSVHSVSAPVLDVDGRPALSVSLYGLPDGLRVTDIAPYGTALTRTAHEVYVAAGKRALTH